MRAVREGPQAGRLQLGHLPWWHQADPRLGQFTHETLVFAEPRPPGAAVTAGLYTVRPRSAAPDAREGWVIYVLVSVYQLVLPPVRSDA